MNEIEAIKLLKNMLPEKVSYANLVGASSCYGDKYVYESPEPYALELAISALEKQIPKKPILMQLAEPEYMCECGMKYWRKGGVKHCIDCGQAIDWSVEE